MAVQVQPQMRPTVQVADHLVRGRCRSRPMVQAQPQMRSTVRVADHHVRGRSWPMVTASAIVRMAGGSGIATLRFGLDVTGAMPGDVLSHSIAIGGGVAGGIAAGLSDVVVPGD